MSLARLCSYSAGQRQALADADVLDAERARLLDHAETGLFIVKEEATPSGPHWV